MRKSFFSSEYNFAALVKEKKVVKEKKKEFFSIFWYRPDQNFPFHLLIVVIIDKD